MTHDVLKEAIFKKAVCHANFAELDHIEYSLNQLNGLNKTEQQAVENIRKELSILFDEQRALLIYSNGFIKDMLAEMTEIKGGKE